MDEAGLDAVSVAAAGAAVSNGILYCFGGGSKNIQFQGTVYDYVQIYRP